MSKQQGPHFGAVAAVPMWLRASEIAGLPGCSARPNEISRIARRHQWNTRLDGNVRFYAFSDLPTETQSELLRRRIASEHPAALTSAYRVGAAFIESLRSPTSKDVLKSPSTIARARLEILRLREAFLISSGLTKSRGTPVFALAYNAARIDAPAQVRDLIPKTSTRTIQRWESSERRSGLTGLEPRHGWRKGRTKIGEHSNVADTILGLIFHKPHIRAKHVHEFLHAQHSELELSETTVRRWMSRWKSENAFAWSKIRNPDAHRSRYLPAFGSASEAFTRLNQQWELDSSPADILLKDGRHTLICAIDVYSRRARLVLSKTSRSSAIAAVCRKAILAWGVPESVRTDNGADYTSTFLGDLLRSLDVEQLLCPPFRGDKKPHVERFFGTLQRDFIELLPGYCGHSVSERQEIESRKSMTHRVSDGRDNVIEITLTSDELRQRLDAWIPIYEATPHSGFGGLSPVEVAQRWSGPVRRIESERALDVLLCEPPKGGRGARSVMKSGVRLEGAEFIAPELAGRTGERVRIRLDPEDLGRVYVFTDDWRFLCVAECPERTGISRAEVAGRAAARMKALDREVAALKRRAKKAITTDDIAGTILDTRARSLMTLSDGHSQHEIFSTPALDAASQVIAELERQKPEKPNLGIEASLQRERDVVFIGRTTARTQ
jgi:hypothetical protein